MSESRRPAVVMVVVAVLAIGAAGCGSASSKRSSSSTTRSVSKPASSDPAASASAASVAVVAGTPITQSAFNHWMYVAAKSQASQTPGTPAIVPDPPAYKGCIAQVRKQLPAFKNKPAKTIVADCRQLFESLSSQVMDFLIKADWIQADGARHGIVATDAQVERAYSNAKNKQFPSGKGYQAFLAKTGQTDQDVRLRFRINLILTRLSAREKGSVTARETAVAKREKKAFAPQTHCTALVLMADCGNYRAG